MKTRNLLFTIIIFSSLYSCTHDDADKRTSTRDKLEYILNKHTLDLWYPTIIDKNNGGYYSNFSYNWTKEATQNKFIVTQTRHVWTLSKALEFYPERTEYQGFARHGYIFLRDKMWDHEFGGFYQLVDSLGNVPEKPYSLEKRAYGNSFGIYALAAFYKISNDPEVLGLAKEAFNWLDEHAHDKEFGGYFQFLERDGTAIPRSVLKDGYNASDKAMVGLKDYNSSIHLLEAFTELYAVWPNETLKNRLREMFEVVSETMYDPRGFLKLHFYPDWTMLKDQEIIEISGEKSRYIDHITFGHDVETAFLLIEAAGALGIDQKEILPKAKQFIDHALEKGWDNTKGGFYDQGKYIDGKMKILDEGKNWWAQAEGMNSLLLMHTLFPDDSHNYLDKFKLQVDYIENNLLDHEYLGWYSYGIDHRPEMKKRRKAQIWKGSYHTSRSLMHCITMLENTNH